MSIEEKNMNTRIQHKHDIEVNWNKALNFIPKIGEVIVYDIDDNYNYSRFKIGDGVRTINDLEFLLDTQYISHNSNTLSQILEQYRSDIENITFEETDPTVPAWAKASTKPTYTAAEVGALPSTTIIPTKLSQLINDSNYATENYVKDQISKIEVSSEDIDLNGYVSKEELLTDEGILKESVLPEGYPYMGIGEVLPETTIVIDPESGEGVIVDELLLSVGNSYIVSYNGTEYTCESKNFLFLNMEFKALGNIGVIDESGEIGITDEPFLILAFPESMAESVRAYAGIYALDGSEEVTLSIYGNVIKKISKDLLPPGGLNNMVDGSGAGSVRSIAASDKIGQNAHAEGWFTTAFGDYSHAEGYSDNNAFDFINEESTNEEIITIWEENKFTLASGDNAHAEGCSTLALGYNAHAEGYSTLALGDNAHAEGCSTLVLGNGSHAEGYHTTASGSYSHAEGYHTIASGDNAHAEGYHTTASGNDSHAEGVKTVALGGRSHAEGSGDKLPDTITSESTNNDIITAWNTSKFLLAKGNSSHAEGQNTLALGNNSHAEGFNTITSSNYSHAEGKGTTSVGRSQHVQGEYNIKDYGYVDELSRYAHIVGNGNDESNRSNAHTLDWEGNAWYAGDVYVGSTSGIDKDSGSKRLSTEEYVNKAITEAVKNLVTEQFVKDYVDAQIKAYIDEAILGGAW